MAYIQPDPGTRPCSLCVHGRRCTLADKRGNPCKAPDFARFAPSHWACDCCGRQRHERTEHPTLGYDGATYCTACCRKAVGALTTYRIGVALDCFGTWSARSHDYNHKLRRQPDPLRAILELAKRLEAGG